MKSPDDVLERYKTINRNRVPALPPPYDATKINQSQVLAADIVSPYDQWTGAMGTSYRLTSSSVLKAEWSHTASGVVSSFIDAPRGSDSANRHINVFSLSYSFTF
jgi:long-subunit fatty acid transport protein